MDAFRLRPRARRRDHGARLPEHHGQGGRVRASAFRGGRCAARGREPTREGRATRARARADAGRSRRAARAGDRLWARAPQCAGSGLGGGRRRGPLHVHLHLRHDRPPEGMHDPPPQLLRDDVVHRADRGSRSRRGRDAALPAARPQLRAADVPLGRLRGLHDRVLPRSLRGRRRAAAGPPHTAPERAPRVREGAHRRHLEVGGRVGAAAATGRSSSAGGSALCDSRESRYRARWPCSTGWPTGWSTRRSKSVSGGACGSASPGALRSRRRSQSSSTRSTS